MKTTALLLALASLIVTASTATTINDPNKYAWGANLGWFDWRGDVASGAVIGEFVCAGYLYSANCGWIHLGDGTPAGGIQYANTSGADFGVNHDGTGLLRGFAYGANIGWILFEPTGNPRFDGTTGRFSGYAWSANCGWINLGDGSFFVKTDTVALGADSDGDGITDAWELREAGNLTTLTAAGDHDGDGASDLAEYLADTGPFDPLDALRVVDFARASDGTKVTLEWTSQPTRRYRITENHDLLAPWTLALDNILPDAGLTTTRGLALAPGDVKHFYKVGAFRPLSE